MFLLSIVACTLLLLTQEAYAFDLKRPTFLKKVAAGLAVAQLSFAGAPITAAHADAVPVVGTAAPDFSLPSNDGGKTISLKDLSGKRTVLYFYPGDFTSGCTIEAQGFERDFQKYKDLGAQIVGVSVDGIDKHLDFGKKYGLEFTLLSDQVSLYTPLCTFIHLHTPSYTLIHPYTPLYTLIHPYTPSNTQGGAVSNKYGSLLDLGFIGKFSNRQTYIISPDLKIEYVFTVSTVPLQTFLSLLSDFTLPSLVHVPVSLLGR